MPTTPIPALSHGTVAPSSVVDGVEGKTDWLKSVRVLWLLGLTASLMTVLRQHRKFARALYAEAGSALIVGETAEGLSMLRHLVHAEMKFKKLARQLASAGKAR